MADKKHKYKDNTEGKYYVDEQCIACDACINEAPKNFQMNHNDGHSLVQKQPANATLRYHVGMALLKKGDKPSAKRELETAMKSNPSKDQAGKIRELLTKI